MSCRHSGNCGLPASTQRRFISSMLGLFTLQQAKKDRKHFQDTVIMMEMHACLHPAPLHSV
jgi:hypothetical protein